MPAIRVTSALLLGLLLSTGCGSDKPAGNPIDCTDPNETRCRTDVTCAMGMKRCGPSHEVHQCKDDGSGWDVIATCSDGQNCNGGQCDPASCTPGQSMCTEDNKVRTCLQGVGTFSTPQMCPVGQTCIGSSCQPQICNPSSRYCEGEMVVRECDAHGTQSRIAESCTGNARCSQGACRSPCIVAEQKNTSVGCLFYGVDLDNHASDDPLEVDFAIANDSDQPGMVKVEVREGANWRSYCTFTIDSRVAKLVGMNKDSSCVVDAPTDNLVDRHLEDSGYAEGAAFRITSDVPIAAYQFNSNDQIRAYSSGGTVLLPAHALGKKYYASVQPQPDVMNLNHPEDVAHGEIVIVGTVDNTKVSVTPKSTVLAGPGVMATPAGTKIEYTINQGAVLQLASSATGDDLSGSLIESDQPIAVFGNNECATVFPRNADSTGFRSTYCDHTEEQLLPVQAWGKDFVGARVRPLPEAPGALDPTVWRIVASEDETTIQLSGPAGAMTTPALGMPIHMMAGETKDVAVMLPMFEAPSDIEFHADKPILIIGYMSGETVAVTAVPVEQMLSKYTFIVPGKFRSQLTVIRPRGAKVIYDGQPMGDNLFISTGGEFEVGRIDFMRDDAIGSNPTAHTIETEAGVDGMKPKIGIEVRGMDEDCSYGYMGGLSIEIINPIG